MSLPRQEPHPQLPVLTRYWRMRIGSPEVNFYNLGSICNLWTECFSKVLHSLVIRRSQGLRG